MRTCVKVGRKVEISRGARRFRSAWRPFRPILAACLLALPAARPGLPQEPAQEPAAAPIRVDVSLVLVSVSLYDGNQRPISSFRPEDLELYEDGVRQEIVYFGRDDLPLNLALVVDVSGSVIPVLPEIKAAARQALSTLKERDAVALFSFARRVRQVVPYTTERHQVIDALARLRAGGGTALIDALYYSAQSLQQSGQDRRRVIVLISDNEGMPLNDQDEGDAIREAQEAGAVVYGIQVRNPDGGPAWAIPTQLLSRRLRRLFRQTGDLKKFASETGGVVLKADREGDIERAFGELMERVARQNYVGYISSNPRQDGSLRRIEVRVSREGRRRLRDVKKMQYRRAYIAAAPVAEPPR